MKLLKKLTALFTRATSGLDLVTISCRHCGGSGQVTKEIASQLPPLCCPACARRMKSAADAGARWPDPNDPRNRRPNQPNIAERLLGR